ncbi:hypothetical protein V8C42DRAFT_328491 [Trichoderma barbatum]
MDDGVRADKRQLDQIPILTCTLVSVVSPLFLSHVYRRSATFVADKYISSGLGGTELCIGIILLADNRGLRN